MSQEVRIGYNIDVNAPGARGATADLRALQEQESKTAEQFLKSATAADKAASAIDNLEKVLKTVSGGQSVDLGATKAFNDIRASVSEVLGLSAKIDSERLSIAVDTSDLKRASVEMRTFLALKREIDQAYLRSEVAAAPRGAERINVVRNQRTSDITRLSGVVPEQDLADLERQTHETADRDILTQNLRPVEQRLTATERTNQRDETRLDEHPDQTRTANNEALRQRLLLLAQDEDSQRRVNALVDQLNLAEANQSAVKYRVDAKNQEVKAQEQLDALVEKSQTAELSRLNRIEAERQQSLSELGGVLPGSTDVINQSFDQQASVERQRQITQSLAPIDRGANTLEAANAKQQEAQAFLEGKEKAVLELRERSLEVKRQEQLAIAKTAEEESLVNSIIDRRIQIEKTTAGALEGARFRREQLQAEEAIARLVEKTNQAELTGAQRVNAERQKFHERYKDQPQEIHQQADVAFDKQASQEEQASGRHGNVRRLVLGAKDLAEGYSRGAVIEGVDYLMSLRGGTGGGPGTGSGGAGGVGGLLGGLSGGAKLGLAAGATAASLALVTVKLTEFVEKEAAAARETVNLGLRMGITGSQAQQLADAAGLVGVKIESIEGGARLLSTALEDPSASGKKSADALTKLGISILDVNGKAREMGPVFLDALAAISKLPSAAERMALATKLLGRGAKELEPLISDYDALNKVVNNLHPVDPTKLAEADKKFQELHEHWQELKRDFATKLIPVIEPLVSGFSNVLTGGSSSADQAKEYAYLLGKHPEVKPGDTYTPTPDEHKDYLAKFGPEAEARRRAERLSQTGPQIPQSVFDTSAHEASRFLSGFQVDADTRRAELGEQLKEAQADQKKALDTITDIQKGAGKSNQVTPDVVKKNEQDLATASAQVARLQSQVKALNAGPRTENRYASERDRIAAEDYKAAHPASEFGRIPELQVERQERLGTIQRDPQFTPTERKTLNSDIERQSNRDIILEARNVAGNQEYKRFGTQQIDTNAGIQGLQEQFSNAQRLTALHAGGKDETEADVEQAYQKQLDLARQIRDIHLSDLQIEKSKLAAIGDHSHDTDIAKDEANAHKQFVDEQVKAESDRLLRTETIRAKEKDEAAKTQEELAKLQTETEAKSFSDKIEHAQKLAELNRQPGESPVTGVQQAYETQLKLAQLEHDTVVAENAITYAGTDQDSIAKRKISDEEALKTLTEDRQKSEYEREEKLAELKKQEREEAKQEAASLYDAIRGGSKGIREFFKGQADQIGKNVFSEIAGPILQNVSGQINPSGGGLLGSALKGTIFGNSTGASHQQGADTAPVQQLTGIKGRLEALLGITPQHQQAHGGTTHLAAPSSAPSLDAHAEPLISSLDNNRDAIHDLTTAILNITPGGGVGPNPLAQNPLGAAAVPESHEVLPGVTELGASSLVQSSKNAVDAVNTLATNQPAVPGPIDFSHLGEFLPEPVKGPISVLGQEEEVGEKSPIQSPLFAPNIHVQPSALSVLSPVTGPSYSTTSNAYHDGGKVQSPLAAPPATASAVAPPVSTGPLQLPPPYVSPPPAAPPAPTAENLSPSGFPILDGKELAASSLSDGILAGAKQIGQGFLDTGPTSLLQAAKRYAIDIPLEEGNKAVASFQKGDYLGAAGHTIASLPVVPGLVSDTVAASQQLAQRGQNDVSQGNYLAAASHDLASLVPIIGPTAVAISDNLADSKTALKGIGQIAGLAATGGVSALDIPKLNLPADHPILEALKDETGSVGAGSGRHVSPAQAALDEINQRFPANPDNPLGRLITNEQGAPIAALEATVREDRLRLKTLQTFEQGKGNGSKALDSVLGIADKHQTVVEGTASSYGNGRLSTDELKQWYATRGFTPEPGFDEAYGYIIRQPKPVIPDIDLPSGRSKLAQSTYKPSTQLKQQLADQSEAELSKTLGIPRTQGNAPFDLQNENLGIEIKTLLDNSNDKITMHPESLNRKLAAVDNTGVTPYTVVADKRSDTPSYYYKQGLGSFRLSSLTPTDSLAGLKRVIDTASAEHRAPTPPSAFQIYSPNEADNLSFDQAASGLTSPAHQRLFDSSKQIDEALGIKSQQSNAIGDWSDGAENSIFNTIEKAPSYDAVRYSAALKGDLANQKAVIPFEVKPKGPDSLYRVTVPNATPEQLRTSLDAEGLQYRALIPKGKVGTEVSVFDSWSQLRDNIERLADKHNVDYRTYQGQGEYLGGDTREAGHDAYHRVISDYEAQTGNRLHERFVGHELPDAATRPVTNAALPQTVIPPEFSATQRFINQAIPEPDSGPISSLAKSPYGFDVLGDKDLASTALTPGILADTGASAPAQPQSDYNPWVLPVLPPYVSPVSSAAAASSPTANVPSRAPQANFAPVRYIPQVPQQRSPLETFASTPLPRVGGIAGNAAHAAQSVANDILTIRAISQYRKQKQQQPPQYVNLPSGQVVKISASDPSSAGSGFKSEAQNLWHRTENLFGGRPKLGPPISSSIPPGTATILGKPSFSEELPAALLATPFAVPAPAKVLPATPDITVPAQSQLSPALDQIGQSLLPALNAFQNQPAPASVQATPVPAFIPTSAAHSGYSAPEPSFLPDLRIPSSSTAGAADAFPGIPVSQTAASPQASSPAPAATSGGFFDALPTPPPYQSPANQQSDSEPVYTPTSGVPTFTAEATATPDVIPAAPPVTTPQTTSSSSIDWDALLNPAQSPIDQSGHAAVIDNGLSGSQGVFGFNTGGNQILSQSERDAADPWGSPGAAFRTFEKGQAAFAGGVQAGFGGGFSGGGGSSPAAGLGGGDINVDTAGLGLSPDDVANLGDFSNSELNQLQNGPSSSFNFRQAVGDSTAVLAGIAGVQAGLKTGGAQGGLETAGSVLGTAAAVDPEPISKAVLGIAAGVTAMIAAFLPNKRAEAQKHQTQEIQTDKLAALAYTQPGINLEESAAGGRSVDTDFQGNSRVLNEKPYVYDINEAIGFDPIHPDRVVTEAVRQVGNQPLPGIPSSLVAPLASTDLTTPVRAQTDTTAYPGTAGSAAQQAQQAQANSPLSSNVTFNNTWHSHAMDAADVMRNSKAITDAVQSQLLTSHRIVGDIRAINNVT